MNTPTITELQTLAKAAHASGLMPSEVRSADAALYIMASGIELGLQPMISLRTLRLVKGRISIAAEAMLALAISREITADWQQADNDAAILVLTRKGGKPYTSAFTMADARKAGLGGDNWTKYPAAMLRARAISAGVRAYCPDVVTGLYSAEEVADFDDAPRTVQIEARQPSPAIENRPAPLAIEARPADAKPTDTQSKIHAAVVELGLESIVDERWGMDCVTWTAATMREIGALTRDTRETRKAAADAAAATVAREDAAAETRPATPAELFRRRVEKRLAECIAAGVMDATIERHGDPDRWTHDTLTAIKGELAALAGGAA